MPGDPNESALGYKGMLLSFLNTIARTSLTKIENDTHEADAAQTKLLNYIFHLQRDTKCGTQYQFAWIGIDDSNFKF